MDMKEILQALDTISKKPVANNSIINESANPHKVALPVQMAMQHYQPVTDLIPVAKESILKKYFIEAEQEINKQKEQKRAVINQYASYIAERVRLRPKI